MEALRSWGGALLDFAYPPHCAVCEAEIAAAEMLCPPCWAEIGTGRRFVCGRYTAFEQIAVLGDFTGALQQAVYAVKFHNQPHLGRALGRRMGRCMAGELAPLDGLLPVPLHPARQRERGYNQSLEIALGLAEALGLPVYASALQRCKNTRQQALLPAAERRDNLRGAFTSAGAVPPGVCLGVVDDVWPTGETLQACARALDRGRLWALVLARTEADIT